MASYISKCGTCGVKNFTSFYSKHAPHDRHGRVDRDYMDSRPVAYCSEECRDKADADQAQPPADPYRNLKNLFADRGLAVVRVTEDAD